MFKTGYNMQLKQDDKSCALPSTLFAAFQYISYNFNLLELP